MQISSLESKEGCPVVPGSSLQKTFLLTPSASSNKTKGGVALDGKLKVLLSLLMIFYVSRCLLMFVNDLVSSMFTEVILFLFSIG